MRILVFGSANVDHVYLLSHFIRPGETQAALSYTRKEGGKGLNQALALARAGQQTAFAGAIGEDGLFLKDYLEAGGVDIAHLQVLESTTGHAIIQVDEKGDNCIVIHGGTNQMITKEMIDQVLSCYSAGDGLLMQNEISNGDYLIRAAKEKGMIVMLNPSPIDPALQEWHLDLIDYFILNEIEGMELTGHEQPEAILDTLLARYPHCHVVLTLGEKGSCYAYEEERIYQPIIPTKAVDTTAAGDTFTGYFIQSIFAGDTPAHALKMAAQASSLAVSRLGAGASIPDRKEVLAALKIQN